MTNTLDFSLLPDDASFKVRSILIGPPDPLKARLASMPQALERLESATWLAAQSSKESDPWRAAALLRASLADYCSIEEMQGLDRPGKSHFKIKDSQNPLLHLLELLRHLNIHVRSVEATAHAISVVWVDKTFDMNVHVISNLDASDLAKLQSGKHYTKADIDRLVDWFKTRQTEWGAGDLIALGAQQLAADICAHFGL